MCSHLGLLPYPLRPPAARPVPFPALACKEELLLDTIMLRLRTADGLDLARLAATHGDEAAALVCKAAQKHVEAGRVSLLDTNAGGGGRGLQSGEPGRERAGGPPSRIMRLTDPQGFLLSNDIISDIFLAFSNAVGAGGPGGGLPK